MTATTVAYAPSAISSITPAKFNYAIGYLKALVIVLVVALHAVLAYHPAATPPPVSLLAHPRIWQTYPVFDRHHAAWAGVFATVCDMFGMALMFFLSGLFVWSGLERKGTCTYMHDRLLRLGVPFIPVAIIIAPLSYYPTYLQIARHGSFVDFVRQWLALGNWSAGPVWFTWVLLVFDWVATSLFRPDSGRGERFVQLTGRIARSPGLFFLLLVAFTTAVYVPMALAFGPFSWAAFGPFNFQISRIFLYFVYFLAGIGVGASGLDRGPLAGNGKLAQRWLLWVIAAAVLFLAHFKVVEVVRQHPLPLTVRAALHSESIMAALTLLPVFCGAACLACLGFFLRFVNRRIRALDNLSRNAYGIFLIHFVFVSWIGYAMTGVEAPALVKFSVVFPGALAASWIGTIMIRRIPGVARIV